MSAMGDVDILDAIDVATGCQFCGGPLGDSPSDDFCSPAHQREWHEASSDGLVGYREPWLDESGIYRLRGDAMVIESFRLPRQTGDLGADRRAWRRAVRTAVTSDQVAACALRNDQLRVREALRAVDTFRAMQPELAEWMQSIGEAFKRMAETCDQVFRQFRSVHTGDDFVGSADPRERALQARRNRNTGPPAARMDGRRGRGVRR